MSLSFRGVRKTHIGSALAVVAATVYVSKRTAGNILTSTRPSLASGDLTRR